jgi:hypothetical protein
MRRAKGIAVMTVADFAAGNYRFLPYAFQYSSGVAAMPGHEIERVTFRKPVPLAEGFARVEAHIRGRGRPLTAFCACELRSPGQFTDQGFIDFNRHYVVTLEKWGVFDGKTNPVARSNVCPEIGAPAEPCFHAFSYTVPSSSAAASFVIAGGGEARPGEGSYRERIVRFGETGADALREKAVFVLEAMEKRLAAFGLTWADTTATQVYTIHDLHPFLASEIVRRGAAHGGLSWHYARPPVEMLDYEMDCRGVAREFAL